MMILLKIISLTLVLLSIADSAPKANNFLSEKFDQLINVYHKNGEFNGCILIAQDGAILYEKAFGYTDFTRSESLSTTHQFRLASVSKQFTAMAVMILKERRKLKYDDSVSIYLQDFPYKKVTIRHLLTHTSGLPDYGGLFEEETAAGNPPKPVVSNNDVYDLLLKYAPPLRFNPGDKHEYSNTGYVILALMTEQVSGQSFQDFVAENIFDPLGMTDSYVNPRNGVLNDTHRAKGFVPDPYREGYVADDWHYQNGMYGDGGVISTLHDLFLWSYALQSEKLVQKTTLGEAFTQVRLNDGSVREYGFGWSVIRQENGIIVVHGGDWLGYTTGILLDLSTGQTVIQLCNMPSRRLIFSLWDILNGRDTEPPEFVKVTFGVRSAELPDSCSVFITGNHRKLGNWDPGVTRLKNVAPHFWKRTISLEKGSDIEYKITRGDWAREAIFEQGIIPANRVLAVKSDTSIVIEVPYWKDTGGI